MIYNMMFLEYKYKDYSNIPQKISLEMKKGNLKRIKKGVYSDNVKGDAEAISNFAYGPSYVSFEYALALYGLIPESINVITCASYGKSKHKYFYTDDINLQYIPIPKDVFHLYVDNRKTTSGINYRIASKEKALCDQLYSMYPVRSIKDLTEMLFDNLRIDEEEFYNLDKVKLLNLCPLYHSNTLKTLEKFIKEKCV